MDERDVILVLAICQIMGHPTKPANVRQAFEKAREQIRNEGRSPRAVKITHAGRDD